MAKPIFKTDQTYVNPYEAIHNKLKMTSPFFEETEWRRWIDKGDINTYANVMSDATSLDAKKVENTYRLDLLNEDDKFAAIMNELYSKKDNAVERFTTEYDDGRPKEVSLGMMSDYDYTKLLLDQTAQYEQKKLNEAARQAEKEANWFPTGMATLFSTLVLQPLEGATRFGMDLFNLPAAVVSGFSAMGEGKSFDEGWRKWYDDADDVYQLDDWLQDFDANNTYLRKADGKLTWGGKYIGQALNTIGYMAPTIVASIFGVPTWATQAIFYTGAFSANIKDNVNNMPDDVPNWQIVLNAAGKAAVEWGVEKLLGKVLGGTWQDDLLYGTHKAGKVGSDVVIKTGSGLTKEGVKTFFKGVGQEVLEELLQDTSTFLVDRASTLFNENFGNNSDLSWETVLDTIVISAISSALMSGTDVAFTKRVQIDEKTKLGKFASKQYLSDLSTFFEYADSVLKDKNASPETKRMMFGRILAGYQTFASLYTEIGEERATRAQKLMQEINDAEKAGKFDSARIDEATEKLVADLTVDKKGVSNIARDNIIAKLKKAAITEELAKVDEEGNIISKDTESKPTESKITEDERKEAKEFVDSLAGVSDETKKKASNVAKKTKKKVVITKDGNNVVKVDDTMFIPVKYIDNYSETTIMNSVAKAEMLDALLANDDIVSMLSSIEKSISKYQWWNKTYDDKTSWTEENRREWLEKLLFDTDTFNTVLFEGDQQVFKFLVKFKQICDDIVKNQISAETKQIYENKFNVIWKDRISKIYIYCCQHPEVDVATLYDIGIFNKTQYDKVQNRRYTYTLGNKLQSGEKLTKAEGDIIYERINSAPIDQRTKDILYKALIFDRISQYLANKDVPKIDRREAVNKLDELYNNIYLGRYNGKTLPTLDSYQNRQFAIVLENNNMTLENWLTGRKSPDVANKIIAFLVKNNFIDETVFSEAMLDEKVKNQLCSTEEFVVEYLQGELRQQGGPTLQIVNTDGKLSVVDETTYDSDEALKIDNAVKSLSYDMTHDNLKDKRYGVRLVHDGTRQKHTKVMFDILASPKSYSSKFLSIDDCLINPSLLREDLYKQMIGKSYSERVHILQKYLAETYKDVGLTFDQTGRILLTTIQKYDDIFIAKPGNTLSDEDLKMFTDMGIPPEFTQFIDLNLDLETAFEEGITVPIEKLINEKFLIGNLKNIKVVLMETEGYGGYYSPSKNTITVNPFLGAFSIHAMIHEFIHALQYFNNLNNGFDLGFVNKLSTSQQDRLLSALSKHLPGIFKDAKTRNEKINVANGVIYSCTGEIGANGFEVEAINIIPFIIPTRKDKLVLITPWGDRFEHKAVNMALATDDTATVAKVVSSFPTLDDKMALRTASKSQSPGYTKAMEMYNTGAVENMTVYENLYFAEENRDTEHDTFAKKVFDVCKQAGLTFTIVPPNKLILPTGQQGLGKYIPSEERISINVNAFNYDGPYSPMWTSTTLLHEAIHGATSYAIDIYEKHVRVTNGTPYIVSRNTGKILFENSAGFEQELNDIGLTPEMYICVKGLNEIYNELARLYTKDELRKQYGFTNVSEMIAEIANPEFKTVLKKKNLFNRIIELILSFFKINSKSTIYHKTFDLVDKLVSEFNRTTYHKYVLNSYLYAQTRYKKSTEKKQSSKPKTVQQKKKQTKKESVKPDKIGDGRTFVNDEMVRNNPILSAYAGKRVNTPILNILLKIGDRYTKLPQELVLLIENGKFNSQTLRRYISTTEKIPRGVYKLVVGYIYRNKYVYENIDSMSTLDSIIELNMPKAFALVEILDKLRIKPEFAEKIDKWLSRKLSPVQIETLYNQFANNPKFKDDIAKAIKKYEIGNKVPDALGIRRKAMMSMYDGTLQSLGEIGAFTGNVLNNIDKNFYKNKSKKRDNDFNTVLDTNDPFANVIESEEIQELRKIIIEDELDEFEKSAPTQKELLKKAYELQEFLDTKSDEWIRERAAKAKLKTEYNIDVNSDVTILKTRDSKIKSIKGFAHTIRVNVPAVRRNNPLLKKDLGKFDKYFDKDLFLDSEAYRKKRADIISELQETLRVVARNAIAGVYNENYSKRQAQTIKKQERTIAKWQADEIFKDKSKSVTIDDEIEIHYASDKPMPKIIESMINVAGQNMAVRQTNVTRIMTENKSHITMAFDDFVALHADNLNNLTTQDVEDIIDFYQNANVIGQATNKASNRLYDYTEVLLLEYILECKDSRFNLTEQQRKVAEDILTDMLSIAGGVLVAHREARKVFKPYEHLMKSLAKKVGISFEDDVEGETVIKNVAKNVATLNNAINNKGDVESALEAMKTAKDEMYNYIAKKYSLKNDSIWEKMVKFERLCMLSSPTTWVRNWMSNPLLTITNKFSEKIGATLIGDKKKIDGQYTIIGTKPTTEVDTFVDEFFMKTGIFDEISDGLAYTKYDSANRVKLGNKNVDGKLLSQMVADSIVAKIWGEKAFNTNTQNKLALSLHEGISRCHKFVMNRLSDNKYVNKAALRYFKAMITEDVAAGKLDLSKGMSDKVLNLLSMAYAQAAIDYMHKTNGFNKLENNLKMQNEALWFAYKQLAPFAAASWNWFVEGIKLTPYGLLHSIIKFAKLENQIAKAEDRQRKGLSTNSPELTRYNIVRDIGKGVIGTIGFILGIILALTGVAVIDEEDDKIKLVVCDTVKVDISELYGTQGITLGMALFSKQKDGGTNIRASIIAHLDAFMDDSIYSDLLNSLRYSDSIGEFLIEQPVNVLGMFIPNFIKVISNAVNVNQKQYSKNFVGQVERLFTQIFPGAAYLLPNQQDPYTGKTMSKYGMPWYLNLINQVSQVKIYSYEMSEQEKLAKSLGLNKEPLTGEYKDIPALSSTEISKLNEYYGSLNEKDLTAFINNKVAYTVENEQGKRVTLRFNKMTDKQKKNVIERIMNDNAKIAKVYIHTSRGGKYYATSSEYTKLKRLDIPGVYLENAKNKGFK